MGLVPKTQKCIHCDKYKLLMYFPNDRFSGYKLNKTKSCKKCTKERYKKWMEKQPEKFKRNIKNSNIKKLYGITYSEYEKMVLIQENKCAICGKEPDLKKYRACHSLAIDHCHKSGMVRGLLCNKCNRALGWFEDSSVILEKALKYLQNYQKEIS